MLFRPLIQDYNVKESVYLKFPTCNTDISFFSRARCRALQIVLLWSINILNMIGWIAMKFNRHLESPEDKL